MKNITEVITQFASAIKQEVQLELPVPEKGEQGLQGIQGVQGEKGEQGETGIPGIKGDSGKDGLPGKDGEKGEKGDKGDKGDSGKDGKNATPDEIIEVIRKEKKIDITDINNSQQLISVIGKTKNIEQDGFRFNGKKYKFSELMHGAGSGGGSSIELQTNGVTNGDQTLLNLIQGTNVTITDDGLGGVTIASTAVPTTPGGSDTQLQFNNAGTFGGAKLDYTDSGFGTIQLQVETGETLTLQGDTGIITNVNDGVDATIVSVYPNGYDLYSTQTVNINSAGAYMLSSFSIKNTSSSFKYDFQGSNTPLAVGSLDFSNLTANQNYAFQDGSGTLAFLSDIPTPTPPGGSQFDVQTNDGAGGFTGDDGFVYQGGLVGIGSGILGNLGFTETLTVLGTVSIIDSISGFKALLDTTLLTRNQAYQFPNKSGIFAMTSDLTGGTVTNVASADGSITVTNPTTTVDLAVVKAPIWSTARLLAGNSVNGSVNVAFANKFIVQGTTDTGLSGAQFLGALGTGIVKNTTTTGVLSIAVAADFPTLNQNTTGSAATLTTSRNIWGQPFNGSADVTGNLTLVGDITGGANNMTITAGTGNSRILTLRTTTAAGAATNAAVFNATQDAGFRTVNANFSAQPSATAPRYFYVFASGALPTNSKGIEIGMRGNDSTQSGVYGADITATQVTNNAASGVLYGGKFTSEALANVQTGYAFYSQYTTGAGAKVVDGGSTLVQMNNNGETVDLRGLYLNLINGGNVSSTLIGNYVKYQHNNAASTLPSFSGMKVELVNGTQTITTARGIAFEGYANSGTITTNYLIYAASNTNIGTNKWGLYFDVDMASYHLGKLGIGTGLTVPTAKLHITAGTATANTAPLKFNSGTLLTAAEAGAVEFLTDAYYVTTTTGAKRRMLVAGTAGRATGQTAANTSVSTYTLGASDASYEVSANVLVTTSSAENFTVTVDYTDEGNTARTVTFNFQTIAGVIGTAINFANGAVPYEGIPLHIRVKASTAITVKTTGTFTGATYNVEGVIKQIA